MCIRDSLYTVRKATQGLADYLNATDLPKKIAIAHDSRNNGELFTLSLIHIWNPSASMIWLTRITATP